MPSIHFSKSVIIESLEQGKTGRRLVEDLRPISILHGRDIDVIYSEVGTKDTFTSQLISLEQEAEKGHWPILHIECHGLENTGLRII